MLEIEPSPLKQSEIISWRIFSSGSKTKGVDVCVWPRLQALHQCFASYSKQSTLSCRTWQTVILNREHPELGRAAIFVKNTHGPPANHGNPDVLQTVPVSGYHWWPAVTLDLAWIAIRYLQVSRQLNLVTRRYLA